MLAEKEYLSLATAELQRLMTSLDELSDAEQEPFEAELSNDILSIEFEDGSKYVVNSHRAARQIWMAAGRSAWHFDYDAHSGTWLATKGTAPGGQQRELWSTLAQQLSIKLGHEVQLART